MLALNLFYWFAAPAFLATVLGAMHPNLSGAIWAFRTLLATASVLFLVRTHHRDVDAGGATVHPPPSRSRCAVAPRARHPARRALLHCRAGRPRERPTR